MRFRFLATSVLAILLPAAGFVAANAAPTPTPKSTTQSATKSTSKKISKEPPESVAKSPVPAAERTVEDVVATLGREANPRIQERFAQAGIAYPPKEAHLLAFKVERRLELWAGGSGAPRLVASYPLLAESGTLGPKLREGDNQIPEGIYRVVWLHPNSEYHLSLKLDYPNAFDREQAKRDGRTELGGDIFIHGSDVSIGCLAVGDPAIEELFVLAARIGMERVKVVVAPWDFRQKEPAAQDGPQPPWLPTLYAELARELASYQ